jgi:hypothetical protein
MPETSAEETQVGDRQDTFQSLSLVAARFALCGTMPIEQVAEYAQRYLPPDLVGPFMEIVREVYEPLEGQPQVEEL